VKLYYDWNFPAAETEFKRALELKADFADAHRGYARCLVSMGRMTDALAQSRRFLQLQPESAAARTQQGWNLLVAGEYDAANEQLRKAIEADPTNYVAHLYLGMAQIRGSKPSEGMASLLKADELSGRSMWAVAKLGAGRAIAAGPGEGVEILAEMSSLSTKVFLSAFDMAVLYAALGEKDTAFTWLESAVEERSPRLVELHVDPFLDRVRKDRRFGDMLRQLGLPEKEQP